MSTSSILRCSRRSVQLTQRCMSSSSSKPAVSSHSTLPPAKIRALISLYHQSETFITPETLSDRIDDAFLRSKVPLSATWASSTSLDDLKDDVKRRRAAPRIGEWQEPNYELGGEGEYSSGVGWSDSKGARERSVIEALYGVDAGGKPGFEVLEESGERAQHDLMELREASRSKE